MRLQLCNQELMSGITHLVKMRTGTYKFVNDLIYLKKLNIKSMNTCLFCKEEVVENPTHLFMHCTAWKREREEILKIPAKVLNDLRLVKCFISNVLGGNMPASGWEPADVLISSSKFISAISKKRQIAIENFSQEI